MEMYRQRETKVTKVSTYSTNFTVRRGFTYQYRMDKDKQKTFDFLLAIWKDHILTTTNDDMNIDEGTLISHESGKFTQIYEVHNIFEMSITLLGAYSGS
jgi:hypothetical protein